MCCRYKLVFYCSCSRAVMCAVFLSRRWSGPDSPDGLRLLAEPTSSPSTLRSLPLRLHSGPATVGDDDPVWKTLDARHSQRPRSPNSAGVAIYTNPYRHDTYRTIDSRSPSSKSPRKWRHWRRERWGVRQRANAPDPRPKLSENLRFCGEIFVQKRKIGSGN